MLNKHELIGNLGADPEMRFMPSGDAIANVSIATTWRKRDKQTGQTVTETDWHRVVFFGKLAEIVEKFLKKGSKVFISGRSRTRSWEDDKGQKHYATEIIASELVMLDSKMPENYPEGNADPGETRQAKPKQNTKPQNKSMPENYSQGNDDFDDDIPFN
jgi:single-strand DNA-binding protein